MADIIKLHDLRPTAGANKPKTRVGRGEASKCKTAGPVSYTHLTLPTIYSV